MTEIAEATAGDAAAAAPALRRGGDPSLAVECRRLPEDVEAVVRDWFAGRITDFEKSGERSVHIPIPAGGHRVVKIKGAGHRGRRIRFRKYRRSGPLAPLFDFDGRRMVDVALGHDGALQGGASMQQAVTEWRVTRLVEAAGHRVVPCLGYGSVFDGRRRSWFSVFGWDDRWLKDMRPPRGDEETFRRMGVATGEVMLDLARGHGLIGFPWMVRDADGSHIVKDLHPFRRADPVNMSRLSWVMQMCHAIHVVALNCKGLSRLYFGADAPEDAAMWPFRAAAPEATLEDWERLRLAVVGPYMVEKPPRNFSPETLQDLLDANPITARLAELCPPEFEPLR